MPTTLDQDFRVDRPIPAQPRAVCYSRLSVVVQDKEFTSIERQELDTRRYCEARGWDIVETITENDIPLKPGQPITRRRKRASASSYSKKIRVGYERMMSIAERGECNVLVFQSLDRFTRQLIELEDLIKLVERRRVVVIDMNGEIDLTSPGGRANARMRVVFAAQEAETTSARVRRAKQGLRENGLPTNGVGAFGWNRVTVSGPRGRGDARYGTVHIPDEADAIREAVAKFLSGEWSVHAIAKTWNERGYRNGSGNVGQWSSSTVRSCLTLPRNGGFMSLPRDHAHPNRKPGPDWATASPWPGIVDAESYRALMHKMTNGGGTWGFHVLNRKHLLSGFLRCGRCGATLNAASHSQWGRQWTCPSYPNRPNCGRLSVTDKHVAPIVAALVLDALESPEYAAAAQARQSAEVDTSELVETINRLRDKLHANQQAWEDDEIDAATLKESNKRLRQRLDAATSELDRIHADNRAELPIPDAEHVRERWESMTVAQQRVVVSGVAEHFTIKPHDAVGNGPRAPMLKGCRFNPERVEPAWRA